MKQHSFAGSTSSSSRSCSPPSRATSPGAPTRPPFPTTWVAPLNRLLDSLQGLGKDVVELSHAHARGELDTMLETRTHGGDFARIASAVNALAGAQASVVRTLTQSLTRLTSAAGQVSSTSLSLSQSASEQAASVEETTASLQQMAASVKQNSENAKINRDRSVSTRTTS